TLDGPTGLLENARPIKPLTRTLGRGIAFRSHDRATHAAAICAGVKINSSLIDQSSSVLTINESPSASSWLETAKREIRRIVAANSMIISSVSSIQTDHQIRNIGSMGDTVVN